MRKHIHTALVILAFASQAHSQFSEIWTNGDLFKVNEMASQCYSASVEKCVAVGVIPNSPSFWDYLLGKNHAKLASVKANISACRPYFVNPSANVLVELTARDTATWSNNIHFLSDCGLPTNALDETPWFKSQYASTTGGWVHTWIMLTNMVASEGAGKFSETNQWYAYGDGTGTTWALEYSTVPAMAYSSNNIEFYSTKPSRYTSGSIYEGGVYYQAEAYSTFMYLGYSVPTSAVERASVAYHKGGPADYWEDFDDQTLVTTNAVFNAQGATVSNGWWLVGSMGTTNIGSIAGLGVGINGDSSNNPGVPSFSATAPTIESDAFSYYYDTLGWQTDDQRIIHNWIATTNGFKFR